MFRSTHYSIRWGFLSFTNKYRIYEDDELLLRVAYEQGGVVGGVRLLDTAGEPVFRIRTERVIVEPTFTIVDESTDEIVGRVRRTGRSWLKRRWQLTDSDGSPVASVRRRSRFGGVGRYVFGGFVLFAPPSYDVVAPDGTTLGTIEGRFRLRDPDSNAERSRLSTLLGTDAGYTYTIDLTDEAAIDPRLVVLGSIAIDVVDAAGTTR